MTHNSMIYIFKIDGKTVEIKSDSQYSAKRKAKRIAGAGVDCVYIGKRESEK